jgi:hypothetical protein
MAEPRLRHFRAANNPVNSKAGSQMSKDKSPKKKSKPARKRPNTKLTGERSEAAFLNRAAALGFGVAKPWGDSLRYDFILDNGQRLWRIQVKCTATIRARAYETRATYTVGKTRAAYTRKDIDFIAAHIVPLDLWYLVPVEECTPAPMLRFYPHRKAKRMRLEKYRELWTPLKPTDAPGNGPFTIYACIDEAWPCGSDTLVRLRQHHQVLIIPDAAGAGPCGPR